MVQVCIYMCYSTFGDLGGLICYAMSISMIEKNSELMSLHNLLLVAIDEIIH